MPILLLLLTLVAAPALGQAPAPQQVVERFLEAYNRHDVDAMVALVHPDVEWLSVDGAEVGVDTRGAQALEEWVRGYLASLPSARSTVEGLMPAGRFVSVCERAHWESRGRARSQSALAVYEVEDGRIRRVWYYPAQP